MKYILLAILAIFISGVIFSACSWTTGGEDIVFPETNVSYINHMQPFLRLNCSYAPCHSDFDKAGYWAFTEYVTMFFCPGFVVPGNADASLLVQILEEKTPHFTYFYRGNILPAHIKGVKTWINEGANGN